MWWLLAIGCAARLAAVPVEASHLGVSVDPPRLPLVPVAVVADEAACEPLAQGLRFALTVHAQQIVLPQARLQLHLSGCALLLSEDVHVDPAHTGTLEDGVEGLDATLIGEAQLLLQIRREGLLLDVLPFSVVRVEQQDWVAGGVYPWRDALGGLTQRDLVEKVEERLIQPHPALLPEAPSR